MAGNPAGHVAEQQAAVPQTTDNSHPAGFDATEQATAQDDAGKLEITDPGTYVLTGEVTGTVVVDPGEGDVTLVMDGVALNGVGGSAIEVKSGNSLTIQAPEHAVNTITTGMPESNMPEITSDIPVRFEGEGVLCAPDDPQAGFQMEQNGAMQEFGPMPGMNQSQQPTMNQGQQPGAPGMNQGQQPGAPDMNQGQQPSMNQGQQPTMPDNGQLGPMPTDSNVTGTVDAATEVVEGTTANSAAELEADYDNATEIEMSADNNQVVIKSSGTYVITGECADGNITVKKGTTGVVLVLSNLDLTSTTGATVSINKEAEVQIVIAGEVVLTDNENPDDENSTDADVADAYDGAALKAKAGSQVYVTGDGTLTINGNAKNGVKAGDDSSIVFDGVTVNITAANDGINGNYDVALLSGSFTIAAGDDAVHADHILTIGNEDGTGPTIKVTKSTEGLEGTVVNVYGGDISIVSTDDAINAANGDGLYEGVLDYSFNMMGGNVVIKSGGDGIDSNGNVNLIGGHATISSSAGAGEAGIDYDGDLYVSDDFQLDNNSGVSGPDMMAGQPGQQGQAGQQGQPGQQGQAGQPRQQQFGQQGQPGQQGGSRR